VICKDQEEVDWYWDLLSVGGEPMACGWIRDRFGICWQITPARMQELTDRGTRAQRKAIMDAMMTMVKFDIAALEAAFAAAAD
jgi:predicted 3-demethylubiquinone-9 3-methyltransferase (glyoxalase superfamily)